MVNRIPTAPIAGRANRVDKLIRQIASIPGKQIGEERLTKIWETDEYWLSRGEAKQAFEDGKGEFYRQLLRAGFKMCRNADEFYRELTTHIKNRDRHHIDMTREKLRVAVLELRIHLKRNPSYPEAYQRFEEALFNLASFFPEDVSRTIVDMLVDETYGKIADQLTFTMQLLGLDFNKEQLKILMIHCPHHHVRYDALRKLWDMDHAEKGVALFNITEMESLLSVGGAYKELESALQSGVHIDKAWSIYEKKMSRYALFFRKEAAWRLLSILGQKVSKKVEDRVVDLFLKFDMPLSRRDLYYLKKSEKFKRQLLAKKRKIKEGLHKKLRSSNQVQAFITPKGALKRTISEFKRTRTAIRRVLSKKADEASLNSILNSMINAAWVMEAIAPKKLSAILTKMLTDEKYSRIADRIVSFIIKSKLYFRPDQLFMMIEKGTVIDTVQWALSILVYMHKVTTKTDILGEKVESLWSLQKNDKDVYLNYLYFRIVSKCFQVPKTTGSLKVMLDALKKASLKARMCMFEMLRRINNVNVLHVMIYLLKNDPDEKIRELVAGYLGNRKVRDKFYLKLLSVVDIITDRQRQERFKFFTQALDTLKHASKNDHSARVQRQAKKSLNKIAALLQLLNPGQNPRLPL